MDVTTTVPGIPPITAPFARKLLMKCSVKLEGCHAEFESPYTDDEAIRALRALVVTRPDINDLA